MQAGKILFEKPQAFLRRRTILNFINKQKCLPRNHRYTMNRSQPLSQFHNIRDFLKKTTQIFFRLKVDLKVMFERLTQVSYGP